MGHLHAVTRRQFIITTAAVAGGLAIGIPRPSATAAPTVANAQPTDFSLWLSISPDDIVTVRVPTPEIGTGTQTGIAMTVTEELQCDWAKVRVEPGPVMPVYVEKDPTLPYAGAGGYFSGSGTDPDRTAALLQIGASARERLKLAAAQQWGVPVSEVDAKDSVLSHAPTARTLSYGAVAAQAAAIKLDPEPAHKPSSAWTFLGKASPGKLTNQSVVDGSAVFGIDVRLPGMLYAALMQSPVHGGTLKRYKFSKIKRMPGVRGIVVVDPTEKRKPLNVATPFPLDMSAPQSAVAVVADHYWQAKMALEALPVEWDDGAGATAWPTTEVINKAAIDALAKPGEKVELSLGNAQDVMGNQPKIVEATYSIPFCEQATMEPLNGTALVTKNGVEVWHPAQHSQMGLFAAAEEAGVAPEKVVFHQTRVGGGFGRRVFANDVRMVVAVAKKFAGTPIHVVWSREETTRQGRYRALMATRMKAGLGKDGLPQALIVRSAGSKPRTPPWEGMSLMGMADTPYSAVIGNVQFESHGIPYHILTGPYRGPNYNANAFFLETFVDECAHAAGIDPLDYRIRLLSRWTDQSWVKCLKVVGRKAGWGKFMPPGMAQGVAITNWEGLGKPDNGSTAAVIATVEVTKKGELIVHEIDIAFDIGRVMNADAVRAEIESGIIFGLNMTLNEGLTVDGGRIVEGNFDQYPMLRIGNMPRRINVHFGALSGVDRYGRVGEFAVGPVGPAIGNAIFKITGKRLRSTPFRLHDLSWA